MWPESVERVASALRQAAVDARIEEFRGPTRSAAEAAEAAGCDESQIVKTLVFMCDGLPVLALVPGDRRADAAKIAAAVAAHDVRIASRDEVAAVTGVEPGAVAPVPVPPGARVAMDQALLLHETVWAGAGSPRHIVALSPRDLARTAGAVPADLSAEA